MSFPLKTLSTQELEDLTEKISIELTKRNDPEEALNKWERYESNSVRITYKYSRLGDDVKWMCTISLKRDTELELFFDMAKGHKSKTSEIRKSAYDKALIECVNHSGFLTGDTRQPKRKRNDEYKPLMTKKRKSEPNSEEGDEPEEVKKLSAKAYRPQAWTRLNLSGDGGIVDSGAGSTPKQESPSVYKALPPTFDEDERFDQDNHEREYKILTKSEKKEMHTVLNKDLLDWKNHRMDEEISEMTTRFDNPNVFGIRG